MSSYFSVEFAYIGKLSFDFEKIERLFGCFKKSNNYFIDRYEREFICLEWKDDYQNILKDNYLYIQDNKEKQLYLSFHTDVCQDNFIKVLKGYGLKYDLFVEVDVTKSRINRACCQHYTISTIYNKNAIEEYIMMIKWYKLFEFYTVGLYQKKKVKSLQEVAKQAVREYDIFCPYNHLNMGPQLNISRQFIKSIIFMKKLPRQTSKKSTNGWFCSWNTFNSIQPDEDDEEEILYKDVLYYYNQLISDPSIAKFEIEISQSFKNSFNINYFVNDHVYSRVYLQDGILVVLSEHRRLHRFLNEVLEINEIFHLTKKSHDPNFFYMLDD